MSSAAELRNVSKVYRRGAEEIHALRDVTVEVHPGELIAVVGHSGSGKTTLLHMLGCMDLPTRGQVRVSGQDTSGLSDRDLSRLRQEQVGFIFQQFFLVPTLTAEENVLLPTLFSKRRRDARPLLERVGIAQRARHRPGEMSGGEMQRVAIARALVNEPKMLLADEPTGNLDSERAEEIFALLREIADAGTAVVVVTHNEELANAASRVIRLRDGRIQAAREHESHP